MACRHLTQLLPYAHPPRVLERVCTECSLCFDNHDGDHGVDVCFSCYNAGCSHNDRNHAALHSAKRSHPIVVNVKRRRKQIPKRDDGEPPLKRLAIRDDDDQKRYSFETCLKCYQCDTNGLELSADQQTDESAQKIVKGIINAMSSSAQTQVKPWELEVTSCTHLSALDQQVSRKIQPTGLAKCSSCELTNNLWLCLICGNLACGRQQVGGAPGNGHGLKHWETAGHPVAVKLGTITPEGTADIYCYQCDEQRVDPELKQHLANWGIEVSAQTKTEKSLSELELEQNQNFEFAMTGEDGKNLEPLFGPGLTGLRNLGNSCYMASVLQTLCALPKFQARYYNNYHCHTVNCRKSPAECIECQMTKVSDGLISGRYAVPRPLTEDTYVGETEEKRFQEGIRPDSFKSLIGKDHPEFSTMRQQDADEFLKHLLRLLKVDNKRMANAKSNGEDIFDPTDIFNFGMQHRLQCDNCKGVRYKVDEVEALSIPVPAREIITNNPDDTGARKVFEPVELTECLDQLTGVEALEYSCPKCEKKVIATQTTSFSTFPEVLAIHARRFQLVNWVPQKLEIPIMTPFSELSLDKYFGRGKQDDEIELPDMSNTSTPQPEVHAEALVQLEAMGFPTLRCQKALLATGNQDPNAAMEWIFTHMDDPDIDEPIKGSSSSPTKFEPTSDQVHMISEMGFTTAQAMKALRQTDGSLERAIEWLFAHPDDTGDDEAAPMDTSKQSIAAGSNAVPAHYRLKAFISHKGPSVHSGHYVAHVRKEKEGWVLFNDEKVVKAEGGAQSAKELAPFAYIYIYERI